MNAENEERRRTDLDLRIEQERETFQLFELRRRGLLTEATTITAAALAGGGLLVASRRELRDVGAPDWLLALALIGLLAAVLFATAARFATWRSAALLIQSEQLLKKWQLGWLLKPVSPSADTATGAGAGQEIEAALKSLRDANANTSSLELRERALGYWQARARSVESIVDFKWRLLRPGLFFLVLPFAYLVVVALALL
jgi:hypothetical protein